MNAMVKETAELLSNLPDDDIALVNELVKKLVLSWDPDFTKVTPSEKEKLDEADTEMKNGLYYSEKDVWK